PAKDLPTPTCLVPKERKIVQRKEIDVMFYVKVRRAKLRPRMRRIRLIRDRSRTFIGKLVDAFAIAVLRIEAEAVAELPAQTRVQCVVICIHVARRYVHREERRAERL